MIGVEIFSTGRFVPSQGPTREWTIEDIDGIIDAFDHNIPEAVHVKLGHTSPEFAQLIAEQLGVPLEVVQGEDPDGDGQISLGRVAVLRRRQNKMVADMDVPEPVADIVEKGFSTVSVELLADFEGREWVLSAVALLGAERPAVKDLAGLAESAVLSDRKPQLVHAFKSKGGVIMSEDIDEPLWDKIKSYIAEALKGKTEHQEEEMDQVALAKQLNLQEGATAEEVTAMIDGIVEAMSGLKAALGLEPGATPEEVEEAAKEQLKEAATFKQGAGKDTVALKEALSEIVKLKEHNRLSFYKEKVNGLTAVEGTPDELAGKLVAIESAMGEDEARAHLGLWMKLQASQKNITRRIGSSLEGEEGNFMEEVTKHIAANKDTSMADAVKFVAKEKPELFEAHNAAVKSDN